MEEPPSKNHNSGCWELGGERYGCSLEKQHLRTQVSQNMIAPFLEGRSNSNSSDPRLPANLVGVVVPVTFGFNLKK